MTGAQHMARCRALRGGVTESEAAIIADLEAMEKLARFVLQGRGENTNTEHMFRDAILQQDGTPSISPSGR